MNYPITDILDLCGIRDATFWPLHRQELSRVAGGRTQAKDLGPCLWRGSFTTSPALIRDAQDIEAALISLNGSVGSFLAHDVRRPYPKLHPGGYVGDLKISALSSGNAFSVQLQAAQGNLTLSRGDYIGFQYNGGASYALHMIQETNVIKSAGGKRTFSVFPAIRPGAEIGAPVSVNKASCEMILEPGQQPPSLQDLAASAVTFSAIQIL